MKKTLLTLLSIFVVLFVFGQSKDRVSSNIEVSKNDGEKIVKKLSGTPQIRISSGSFVPQKLRNTSDVRLFESFEAYPDDDSIWIPSNWSRYIGPDDEGEEDWYVTDLYESFYGSYTATDGDFFAEIDFDFNFDTFEARAQDRGLISPAFTPQADDSVFFDLYHAAIFMYYKYDEVEEAYIIDFSSPMATMKLCIQPTGADSVVVWDLHDLVSRYDAENIWDCLGQWESFKVSLDKYVGQEIKIGFYYNGKDGDSMCLDNILVGNEASSSIEQTQKQSAFSAIKSGDSFKLTYPSGFDTASLYTVGGKLESTHVLPEAGTASIAANGLSKGIYLIKFSGDKSTHVVKVFNK